MKIFQKM